MVEGDSSSTDSAAMAVETVEEVATPAPVEEVEVEKTFHQVLKEKFIDGGLMFMSFVLICLILGLALSIERILYLSLSTTNTKKLLEEVEGALSSNGVKGAKEVCRNTSGPVASIFYQGLERSDEGLDMVEKTVVVSTKNDMAMRYRNDYALLFANDEYDEWGSSIHTWRSNPLLSEKDINEAKKTSTRVRCSSWRTCRPMSSPWTRGRPGLPKWAWPCSSARLSSTLQNW